MEFATSTTCSAAPCRTPSLPPRRSLTPSSPRMRPRRLAGRRSSGARVQDAVLAGFTAFSDDDARPCGQAPAGAWASAHQAGAGDRQGGGRVVVSDLAALEAVLDTIDAVRLAEDGLVLEENLTEVTTYSVGQVRVAEPDGILLRHPASHAGQQRRDRVRGVRAGRRTGRFRGLGRTQSSEDARLAVAQARVYDASRHGLLSRHVRLAPQLRHGPRAATRRGGCAAACWSSPGASVARVAPRSRHWKPSAPSLDCARCAPARWRSTVRAEPPPHATVYFQGVDERDGPMTKYALT